MFYTYVLLCFEKSANKIKFYIGSTSDLKTRIKAHKSRYVRSTKSYDKIILIYYEGCLSKRDARKRELQLKTGFGRGYLKRRLEDYLIASGLASTKLSVGGIS